MGTVWSATHTVTRARVALKLLDARSGARAELRQRFIAEARAASAIDHPNVIAVHDVFELDDGTPVMVLDLLEGETLAARLARTERLSLAQTAAVIVPVIDAVMAAHRQGIVHRDLKPDNVFLERAADGAETPKVLDFGIAKLLDDDGDRVVTGTGMTLGTPGYMSPEQGFGEKDIDARADVWALGVILYECLSGVRPVEGDNLGQYLKRLMNDAITPLEVLEPELPQRVHSVVGRMLAVDRDERLIELGEVIRTLEGGSSPPQALARAPRASRSRRLLVAACSPLVLAGAWWLVRVGGSPPATADVAATVPDAPATSAAAPARDSSPEARAPAPRAAAADAPTLAASTTTPAPPRPSHAPRPSSPEKAPDVAPSVAAPLPPPSPSLDPGGLVDVPPF
jgi:serine/threonine protein kinase